MIKKNSFYLILIAIVIGGYVYFKVEDENQVMTLDLTNYPIYQSQKATTYIYGAEGRLEEVIKANNVQYFEQNNYTLFDDPEIDFYDDNIVAQWKLTSEKAKLANNQDLYLIGKVVIDNLLENAEIKKIVTSNAVVNLDTQVATSDENVTAYGNNIITKGIGVVTDLNTKQTDVLNDVKTEYRVQRIEIE